MGKRKSERTDGTASSDRINRQVFDKLGKIIYKDASSRAAANSLRGLFKTELSPETPVVFAATESIREQNDRLEKQVSDLVLTAGDREFEIEFQTSDDETMGSRMFGYGYAQAERHKPAVSGKGAETVFDFPEAVVIYLEPTKETPEKIQIKIRHRGKVVPVYEARTYKLLEHSLADMEAEKLHLLTPFYLMKHRREAKEPKASTERKRELAHATLAIADEIAALLERGVRTGAIAPKDMELLIERTYFLYRELYGTVSEFKEGIMRFEDRFKSVVLEQEARWEARLQAEKEAAVKQAIGLFKQGYTPEQVEQMLSREGVFQPAAT